jgi:hypothetical protein
MGIRWLEVGAEAWYRWCSCLVRRSLVPAEPTRCLFHIGAVGLESSQFHQPGRQAHPRLLSVCVDHTSRLANETHRWCGQDVNSRERYFRAFRGHQLKWEVIITTKGPLAFSRLVEETDRQGQSLVMCLPGMRCIGKGRSVSTRRSLPCPTSQVRERIISFALRTFEMPCHHLSLASAWRGGPSQHSPLIRALCGPLGVVRGPGVRAPQWASLGRHLQNLGNSLELWSPACVDCFHDR